jgi:hypothetical protein
MGCCGSKARNIVPEEDYSAYSETNVHEKIFDELVKTRNLVEDMIWGFEHWGFLPPEEGLPPPLSPSALSIELISD